MTSTQTILAATDLSAPARHAVERAFHLAAATASELHILHALDLDALDSLREMLGGDVSSVRAAMENDARTHLDQLNTDAGVHRGVAAETKMVTGDPLTVIAAEADALNAHIVVLGARGESFLRHALLGSTAARLLRKSVKQPVLVVKQAPHEAYRNVLIAVDFSPISLQAIRTARQLAPNADLVLLHAFGLPYEGKLYLAGVDEQVIRQYVTKEENMRRQRLHNLAATAGLAPVEYSGRVIHGDPWQQVLALEQEVDADLIVVGKHGSHIAEDLLLGSVTRHVLADSQCDVLILCDPHQPPEELP